MAKESVSLEELGSILDGIKYEIADNLQNLKRLNIKNSEETIEELIEKRASFCRFGDGEFSLINGESIGFQRADPKLAKRLLEILQSDIQNIFIGIPHCYYSSVEEMRAFPKSFMRTWVARNRTQITELAISSKQYYDTACTQLYALYETFDFRRYFSRIKQIWRDRDVVIICGKTVFDGIDINIFDCAKSIEYQYAPSFDAFEAYDGLLASAKQIGKDKLVIIILGPTATVLAYDMAKEGYQALDLGHIAKDYDFFSKGMTHNSETIANFFKPD
jgi:glycosyltransferase family protein